MGFLAVMSAIGLAGLCVAVRPRAVRRRVERRVRQVERATGVVAPTEDWPTLHARLRSREIGWAFGAFGVLPLVGLLQLLWPELDPLSAVWLVAACPTAGTMVGHLSPVGRRPRSPRAAERPARRLRDYLTPAELGLTGLAGVVALAAGVLGWAAAGRAPEAGGGWVMAAGAAALAIGLLFVPPSRRVLTAPTGMTTRDGVAWAEVMRAMMLRDIAGAGWMACLVVPTLAVWSALTAPEQAAAVWEPGAWAMLVLALLVLGGLSWAGLRDNRYRWAQEHVRAGTVR